jgi:hypothetical protein
MRDHAEIGVFPEGGNQHCLVWRRKKKIGNLSA